MRENEAEWKIFPRDYDGASWISVSVWRTGPVTGVTPGDIVRNLHNRNAAQVFRRAARLSHRQQQKSQAMPTASMQTCHEIASLPSAAQDLKHYLPHDPGTQ